MAPRLHITLDDLHAAWQQRRRADWPATFPEAMAHPMLRPLVRAEAVRRALAARRQMQHAPQARPAHPAPRRPTAAPAQAPLFDRKRAAAGERADD